MPTKKSVNFKLPLRISFPFCNYHVSLHFSNVQRYPSRRLLIYIGIGLQVVIHVDEEFTRSGTTVGEFTMLASKRLYVAGSPEPGELPGAKVRDNFRGCMRKVSHVSFGCYYGHGSRKSVV